jgi:hypothetical protein
MGEPKQSTWGYQRLSASSTSSHDLLLQLQPQPAPRMLNGRLPAVPSCLPVSPAVQRSSGPNDNPTIPNPAWKSLSTITGFGPWGVTGNCKVRDTQLVGVLLSRQGLRPC